VTRKKIAQLVLLVGVLVVGVTFARSCDHAPVATEIHYLLGDPPIAAGLEVIAEPPEGGAAYDHFQTTLVSPDVKQTPRLPLGDIKLDITLVGANGNRRSVTRTITVERNAVIRLDISREPAP
jgi:hypothetical protein